MEVKEESWLFRVAAALVAVDKADAQFVEQLQARDWQGAGHDTIRGLTGDAQVGEEGAQSMDKGRAWIDAQNQAGDNTERARRADKEVLEVVAATGLAHRPAQ